MEETKKEEAAVRLQAILARTMDLAEEILDDEDQFRRHLVKNRGEGEAELVEQVYRKVDTKALKEFISGLKELRAMTGQEEAPQEPLRVIFEAGEDCFNE